MSKKKMRKEHALAEIARQRARRRAGIIQASLGGIAAVFALLGFQLLQMYGILPTSNTIVSLLNFVLAVVACALLGMGFRTISATSSQINSLRQRYGIDKEDFRN